MQLLISMPGGSEWLFIVFLFLFLLVGVPIICYRAGFKSGKRQGELETYRRNNPGSH